MNRPGAGRVDRRVKGSLATAAVLVGALAACSSGGDKSGSDFASQYCALLSTCCAGAGLPSNPQQCTELSAAAVSQGSYSAADGQTCIAQLQAEQSAGTLCSDLGASIPQCQTAFQAAGGTTAPGGTCTSDTDCAPASGGSATCFTNFDSSSSGGTPTQVCVQTKKGQAGDGPCIGDTQADVTVYEWSGTAGPPSLGYLCDPATGTRCDQTTQKCLALMPTGSACSDDSTCVVSDYCGFSGALQTCTPRLADGSSCADDSTSCLATSTCDETTETCKALLANGAPCTDPSQCQSSACGNGVCTSFGSGLALGLLCGGP
ncbi:MAG TPA: hypothetical protein VGG39_27345 [Polyangiaceae bacterium]|jgi:hypothetical protein